MMERYLELTIHNGHKKLTLYDKGQVVPKVNKIPLSNFSDAIQSFFKDAAEGSKEECDPGTGLKPPALKLKTMPSHKKPNSNDHKSQYGQNYSSRGSGGYNPHHTSTPPIKITRVTEKNVAFNNGAEEAPEKLGLADQVIGTQIGSMYSIQGRGKIFNTYTPDIQSGLGRSPDIDKNPYNFAEWHDKPWVDETEPRSITHEKEHKHRISGRINIELTAQTPLFIPHSSNETGELTLHFFKAWNGHKECYAIPGSSFKGVIRSLFESLTNSRFGVSDQDLPKNPPLYRRRATTLFKIEQLPTETQDGIVVECKYDFLDDTERQVPVKHRGNQLSSHELSIATKINWRANLFHVHSKDYNHKQKTKLAYIETERQHTFKQLTYKAYQNMFTYDKKNHRYHQHLEKHLENAKAFNAYKKPFLEESLNQKSIKNTNAKYIDQLRTLSVGDIIFGISQNKSLVCFGKNVNFLWPGETTPRELMGGFLQREQAQGQLKGSDMAESVFGFIGDDGQTNGEKSHSFRGRVRFTPLWAKGQPQAMEEVQLMPLTSPSGTKLKSRPLYLKPSQEYQKNGKYLSADYSDKEVSLKGRKFYWHQQAPEGQTIAKVHDYNQMKQENGPSHNQEMLPSPICPLPAQTRFKGEVHFANFSEEELGALLTALSPQLAFKSENERYGLKIGKGKPRGLGSVTSELEVFTLTPAAQRYQSFDSDIFNKADNLQQYIEAYKRWCQQKSGKAWNELPFIQDLNKLLRLPGSPSVHTYPPRFDMFGWMPEFDSPQGEPKSKATNRAIAMRQARDV